VCQLFNGLTDQGGTAASRDGAAAGRTYACPGAGGRRPHAAMATPPHAQQASPRSKQYDYDHPCHGPAAAGKRGEDGEEEEHGASRAHGSGRAGSCAVPVRLILIGPRPVRLPRASSSRAHPAWRWRPPTCLPDAMLYARLGSHAIGHDTATGTRRRSSPSRHRTRSEADGSSRHRRIIRHHSHPKNQNFFFSIFSIIYNFTALHTALNINKKK